ncbi:MAG: FecR domain-containing protein [Giesbergeria sp.]|nr:FecR domain-containing protein [Giesbergeria sp.]
MPVKFPVFFVITVTKLSPSFAIACAGLLVGTVMVGAVVPAHARPGVVDAVGEVTLTVGKAMIVGADGTATAVRRGASVHAGDRVETAEGGHVHIRFVDGALVSVRPTSRLVVEDYQYNPVQIEQSLVRFRLDRGVARAISGAAAEGARERFRLNTPLVAIGVRGTDFVVRAGEGQTQAYVNQGAIVMAPFGEGCQPQAIDPCGSVTAKLLTAGMGDMLLEFRDNFAQPQIKPINSLLPSIKPTAVADARPSAGDGLAARDLAAHNGMGEEAVVAVMVRGAVSGAGERDVAVGPVPVQPSEPVVPVQPPAPPQLAWGRWSAAVRVSDISVTRDQARLGRVVTVGNNDYALYRAENGPAFLAQSLGSASFVLQQSQAQFTSAGAQVQPAQVLGGSLTLDFAARQFSTALNLTSAATGPASLQAAGFLREDGLFNSRSSTQAVAGAVALDARTAGYLFEKAAAGGMLSGITLWGR